MSDFDLLLLLILGFIALCVIIANVAPFLAMLDEILYEHRAKRRRKQ